MNSPDYLEGKTHPPQNDGPSRLLNDGQWCGHGEPQYEVFDIWSENENLFRVQLPFPNTDGLTPQVVIVESESGLAFEAYDERKHPSSMYHPDHCSRITVPRMQNAYQCPECGKGKFKVAVGFEIPSDSDSPNDTTWFALAVRCANCQWEGTIYEDETG